MTHDRNDASKEPAGRAVVAEHQLEHDWEALGFANVTEAHLMLAAVDLKNPTSRREFAALKSGRPEPMNKFTLERLLLRQQARKDATV